MMEPDYPAAHSMDTAWFAVDSQGFVAMFDSGENGHVPCSMRSADGVWHDIAYHPLWELCFSGLQGVYRLADMAQRIGLYYYNYDEEGFDPLEPYVREIQPNVPLHVDQLPPELRQECKRIRFEKVLFVQSERIQPLEYFACTFWYQDNRVAYLTGDGKTVRPLPGMEDYFREFYDQFRQESPDRVQELRFEGID
jgi:hypothetical protein